MRACLIAALSTILAMPVIALAQDPAQQNTDPTKQGASAQTPATASKAGNVKGTISEDGKSFVSDSDGKSWTIANPDAVKGHEGHHVELKGSTDPGTSQIQVSSVKMLKGEKNSMKKDSSQPQ